MRRPGMNPAQHVTPPTPQASRPAPPPSSAGGRRAFDESAGLRVSCSVAREDRGDQGHVAGDAKAGEGWAGRDKGWRPRTRVGRTVVGSALTARASAVGCDARAAERAEMLCGCGGATPCCALAGAPPALPDLPSAGRGLVGLHAPTFLNTLRFFITVCTTGAPPPAACAPIWAPSVAGGGRDLSPPSEAAGCGVP